MKQSTDIQGCTLLYSFHRVQKYCPVGTNILSLRKNHIFRRSRLYRERLVPLQSAFHPTSVRQRADGSDIPCDVRFHPLWSYDQYILCRTTIPPIVVRLYFSHRTAKGRINTILPLFLQTADIQPSYHQADDSLPSP